MPVKKVASDSIMGAALFLYAAAGAGLSTIFNQARLANETVPIRDDSGRIVGSMSSDAVAQMVGAPSFFSIGGHAIGSKP